MCSQMLKGRCSPRAEEKRPLPLQEKTLVFTAQANVLMAELSVGGACYREGTGFAGGNL